MFQLAAVQISQNSFSLTKLDRLVAHELKPEIRMKGIHVSDRAVAVWDGQKILIFEADESGNSVVVGMLSKTLKEYSNLIFNCALSYFRKFFVQLCNSRLVWAKCLCSRRWEDTSSDVPGLYCCVCVYDTQCRSLVNSALGYSQTASSSGRRGRSAPPY